MNTITNVLKRLQLNSVSIHAKSLLYRIICSNFCIHCHQALGFGIQKKYTTLYTH